MHPTGVQVAKAGDYVCKNNVLNCSNHKSDPPPIPGGTYKTQLGTLITYQSAENDEKKEIIFVKGHYQIPVFYEPDYEKNPNERLIPDFRNTPDWSSLKTTSSIQ